MQLFFVLVWGMGYDVVLVGVRLGYGVCMMFV